MYLFSRNEKRHSLAEKSGFFFRKFKTQTDNEVELKGFISEISILLVSYKCHLNLGKRSKCFLNLELFK